MENKMEQRVFFKKIRVLYELRGLYINRVQQKARRRWTRRLGIVEVLGIKN